MFESDKTLQPRLFAFTPRDLVSSDSDIWLYIDLFESLNYRRFNQKYRGQGQLAKEPKLMLRTIFYGLTHGIVSGRKLESSCRNDNRFIVLSGELRPDRRTIDRFLSRHQELMHELFVDVVRLAQKMGLVSLGKVAVDGSRFEANTSWGRSMSYDKMQRAVGYIEENLKKLREDLSKSNSEEANDDVLPEEIASEERRLEKIKKAVAEIENEYKDKVKHRNGNQPKASSRKSLNDSEALSMSHKNRSSMFGYNAQAAVDEETQIIVAASIHDKPTDYGALPDLLDQVAENCHSQPKAILADRGYKSAENVKAIEARSATAYIAVGKEEEVTEQFFEQLVPTGEPHEYKCRSGNILPIESRSKGRTTFKLSPEFCQGCAFTATCKAFGKKRVSIMPEEDRKIIADLHQRARQSEYKEVYRRRKVIVEPVFGNIKNKGLRIFVVGRKKVSAWWALVCTAHNIEKMAKALIKRPHLLPI